MRLLIPYVNPQWGLSAPDAVSLAIVLGVNLFHHECDNPVCKMVRLHLRRRVPRPLAAREPQRRHPRVDQGRVRQRADQLFQPDGAVA